MDAATSSSRVALVTGAARGLGAALSAEIAGEDLTVIMVDRDAPALEQSAAAIRADGGDAVAMSLDVSDPAAIDALAAQAQARFGPLGLLVNNAGIELVGRIWELPADDIERIVGVNLLGAMHMVRAFLPAMIEAGRPAQVVNLSSLGGLGAMPMQTAYILTKHALRSYSEGLALELAEFAPHIGVSVVLPGAVDTPIFDHAGTEDSESGRFRSTMRAMLAGQGLSPREAARRIMAQVRKGRFWVSCHDDQLEALARERGLLLAALAEPALDENGRELMRQIRQGDV